MRKEIITTVVLAVVICFLECSFQLWSGIYREEGIWFPDTTSRLRFLVSGLLIYLAAGLVVGLVSSVLVRIQPLRRISNNISVPFLGAGIFLGLFAVTRVFYGGLPIWWPRVAVAAGETGVFLGGVAAGLLFWRLFVSKMSSVPRRVFTKLFLLLGFAQAGFNLFLVWFAPFPEEVADTRPNIILISIDTLRRDRLGCYGYQRPVTPRIDNLSRRGTIFDNAYAQYHSTLPSHMSIMTSLPPLVHGVIEDRDLLSGRIPTLAELLSHSGYRCLAFVDGKKRSKIGGAHGFSRGFQWYGHYPENTTVLSRLLPVRFLLGAKVLLNRFFPAHGRAITDNVIAWLRNRPPGPFFLFLHYYGVHAQPSGLPYWRYPPRDQELVDLPVRPDRFKIGGVSGARFLLRITGSSRLESFRKKDLPVLQQLYDCGVSYIDEQVGLLEEALDRLGLLESTALIVTSDHGEEFLEHGLLSHRQDYGECLRVPLVIVPPGGTEKPGRIGSLVSGIDMAPTILDLAGLTLPESMMGISLLPILRGQASPDRTILCGEGRVLHSPRYSLLKREGKFELYDLKDDPRQMDELGSFRPDVRARCLEDFREMSRDYSRRRALLGLEGEKTMLELPARDRRDLETLGYAD